LNISAITLAAAAIDLKYKDAPYYLDLALLAAAVLDKKYKDAPYYLDLKCPPLHWPLLDT